MSEPERMGLFTADGLNAEVGLYVRVNSAFHDNYGYAGWIESIGLDGVCELRMETRCPYPTHVSQLIRGDKPSGVEISALTGQHPHVRRQTAGVDAKEAGLGDNEGEKND